MNPLTKLNKNWIYETIVTTWNEEPHSAPIGISTPDHEKIVLKLYKTSKTYKNVLNSRIFVVNFVDDVELFYKAIFEKEKLSYRKVTHGGDYPVLEGAAAYMGAEVSGIREDEDAALISSDVIFSGINKEFNESFLFNRAKSLALECITAYTKMDAGVEGEFFRKEILNNYGIIKKVAPGSNYERLVKEILNKI
ncbi:MAG: hypothetical protein A7316_00140 [Candidatus Altiarchaeales archaeon WOR_SM1_86-2]|nr:MAG: hypothetical protein A7316_00140 [Candidatus Altiarchaeales archaeon WOR_SM1_86-2]